MGGSGGTSLRALSRSTEEFWSLSMISVMTSGPSVKSPLAVLLRRLREESLSESDVLQYCNRSRSSQEILLNCL